MPSLRLVPNSFSQEFETGFSQIRDEMAIPVTFPEPVLDAARAAAAAGPKLPPGVTKPYIDRTDLALITIDPPTSTDLDQAFYAEATAHGGYRVWYAIADVAAFVHPDDPLDVEARERGVTLYCPDMRASLHPEEINEAAASLLPDTTKPAVLWRIDLDDQGRQVDVHVERAMVMSRAKLSYAHAQAGIDANRGDSTLELLRTIGQARQRLEIERGAISLQLPAQEITRMANGDYELAFDTSLAVEGWNAQISLLTGMAAAGLMIQAGQGLLRTLPPLDEVTVAQVRRSANALGIEWDDSVSYPDRVRLLDPNVPAQAALLTRAARSFRGAGYEAFTGGKLPDQPLHGAIASTYSHVTAPLRRICDRYANEIVLAHCGGYEPPAWTIERLDELPKIMGAARQKDRSLERAIVDFVEAVALQSRIGERFQGVVLGHRRNGADVQISNPAVIAAVNSKPPIGSTVDLELRQVDTTARRVIFVTTG